MAAASPLALVNRALARVGETQFLDDLAENTASARAVAVSYRPKLLQLLAAHPWRFASRFAALVRVDGEAVLPWRFAYALPANCLVPRRVWRPEDSAAVQGGREVRPVPYAESAAEAYGGRVLRCDEEAPVLEYTADDVPEVHWTPAFDEAFVAALAVELAFSVAKRPELAQGLTAAAERARRVAEAEDYNAAQRRLPVRRAPFHGGFL